MQTLNNYISTTSCKLHLYKLYWILQNTYTTQKRTYRIISQKQALCRMSENVLLLSYDHDQVSHVENGNLRVGSVVFGKMYFLGGGDTEIGKNGIQKIVL